MNKEIVVLGSTGSIGSSTLNIISKNKKFKLVLLSANKNINKLFKQSVKFKVKHAVINDFKKFDEFKLKFKKKKNKITPWFQKYRTNF